ncbi:MAG TPA: hypothetical protein VG675_04085 [Bryobacteraceae bacterium]|nr:hypothetical protein [Bryobacteraceae bacterium]
MKQRARRVMGVWFGGQPHPSNQRNIGVCASTHCRPCSCFLCQPGREVPPRRERAFQELDFS